MLDPFIVCAGLLLVLGAGWDIARFQIPNAISVALVGLFVARALVLPDATNELGHLMPAVITFIVTALLFVRGLMGGGDVKLMTSATLWMPPALILPQVVAVSTVGAGLAVILTAIRKVIRATTPAGTPEISLPHVLREGAPVPYGVAITAGTLLYLPWIC